MWIQSGDKIQLDDGQHLFPLAHLFMDDDDESVILIGSRDVCIADFCRAVVTRNLW